MIINCKECGGKVSTDAAFCPHCGSRHFRNISSVQQDANSRSGASFASQLSKTGKSRNQYLKELYDEERKKALTTVENRIRREVTTANEKGWRKTKITIEERIVLLRQEDISLAAYTNIYKEATKTILKELGLRHSLIRTEIDSESPRYLRVYVTVKW